MSTERRRYVRLTTDHNVQCSIEGVDVVHVVGMGSGGSGMRVITNRELPEGEFPIELDLNDGGPLLQLRGRAVWQESWDFEIFNRHAAGIELSGMDTEAANRIDQLIQSPASEGSESPQVP